MRDCEAVANTVGEESKVKVDVRLIAYLSHLALHRLRGRQIGSSTAIRLVAVTTVRWECIVLHLNFHSYGGRCRVRLLLHTAVDYSCKHCKK